jgi:hypothetical protein
MTKAFQNHIAAIGKKGMKIKTFQKHMIFYLNAL